MQPTNNQQLKTDRAFTLIELLVVIAIVGILAGLAVVNMSGATEAARIAKLKVYSNSIRSSLMGNRVSEWKFDEGTGTTTADTVGTNNGTLLPALGPVWKTGSDCVSGGCLYFDGSDDYVSVGNDASLDIANEITIEAWAKPTGIGNPTQFNMITGRGYYYLNYYDSGIFSVSITDLDSVQRVAVSSNSYPLNYWYHVVGVYRNNQTYIYVNGVQRPGASGNGIKLAPSSPCQIGNYSSGYPFNGFIDEVRIYNAALTASAIRDRYLSGIDKLLSSGQITKKEYQQRLADLDSTYATNK